MEEALHDVPLYCGFAHLDPGTARLPDESTVLRLRHLLEENNLSIQLLVTINATLTQGHGLLHGDEQVVFADAGYQGATKRAEATGVDWQIAMRPGKRRALDKSSA
jgi:IS5 family transposase